MYFDWWPTKGTTEWAELALAEALAGLGGRGLLVRRHRPRAGARARVLALLYREATRGCRSTTADSYGSARDSYNRVRFTPVETSALRLEVTLQTNCSAGLQEWRVR